MTEVDQQRITDPITPEQLEVIAHREAAYAVAFLEHGFTIVDISIVPESGVQGVRIKRFIPLEPITDAPTARSFYSKACLAYLCMMAGQSAMARFDPSLWPNDEDEDWSCTEDEDANASPSSAAPNASVNARADATGQFLRKEAVDLVERHWGQITRLAGLLLERGTLTGDEVIAMIRGVPIAAGTAAERAH